MHEGLEKHGDILLEIERAGYNLLLLNENSWDNMNDLLNENIFTDGYNFVKNKIVKPAAKGISTAFTTVSNGVKKVYNYGKCVHNLEHAFL